MAIYKTKINKLSGTNLTEVYYQARQVFRPFKQRTKRKPYIRAPYFGKRKVFFEIFWSHLENKNPRDRFERLKYFAAAIDLMQHTRMKPTSKPNPNRSTQILHRFSGIMPNGQLFYVQIKENTRSKRLHFLSTFPERK